jgi:hypothetical protein
MAMRLFLSLFEFLLTILMAVAVVFINYRLAIRTNRDYDAEQQIRDRNMGVAILMAACLVSAGLIVKNGIFPVVSMVRLALTTDGFYLSAVQVAGIALVQLLLVFAAAIFSISFSLRLFGKLTRRVHEGRELAVGNPAVGVLLAAVVFVVALFVSDSMSSITRALVPQPSLGTTTGTIEFTQ